MKLKVGGLTYKVKHRDIEGIEALMGYWDMQRLTIVVQEDMPKDLEAQTIIHELQHAINEQAGLENDEDTTGRLANVWHQVLRDNWKALSELFNG